ncbi:CDP-glucose 4,6-dehydratase [Bacillus sp. Marseille-P3800]|uniref:CDP-glucose 4,6-dehydratase n=1 Tax=Bacillus sp. Marseille-P3800 TaxID=2014782 RepID=UPI00159BBF17|nr:CDP-glucose 4,6-dehydratase [Bacillus sp. Marseille-P3800]
MDKSFWQGKRVLITGHTGFKGRWLCAWLGRLGAHVYGLSEASGDRMFEQQLEQSFGIRQFMTDILNPVQVEEVVDEVQPEIIFHMAAQPIVSEAYIKARATIELNIMGAVNLLEAVRKQKKSNVLAIINVTTDKVYENKEWVWGYREGDELGGSEPYSTSKSCSELITSMYGQAFFHSKSGRPIPIATARIGNVIGGTDWSKDRLLPDCIRAIQEGKSLKVRSRYATRPWQHALEPLSGYLLLAQKLVEKGQSFSGPWNFAVPEEKSVDYVVDVIQREYPNRLNVEYGQGTFYEASNLKLDSSKARLTLGWKPRWNVETAIKKTVSFYLQDNGANRLNLMEEQIMEYEQTRESSEPFQKIE